AARRARNTTTRTTQERATGNLPRSAPVGTIAFACSPPLHDDGPRPSTTNPLQTLPPHAVGLANKRGHIYTLLLRGQHPTGGADARLVIGSRSSKALRPADMSASLPEEVDRRSTCANTRGKSAPFRAE